jgi:hypothetical protein
MKIERIEEYVKRALAVATLAFITVLPCFVGFWVLVEILQDPFNARPVLFPVLAVCSFSAYFLMVLIWRAITWSTPRKDGGLVPPAVMYFFPAATFSLFAVSAIIGFSTGHYFNGARLVAAAVGILMLALMIRRRSIQSRISSSKKSGSM